MASPSDDDKPQTPSGQAGEDSKVESLKEISPPSVFVNSEPIREDQVQNAVKFLSHPKVQGSPVMYRRSFLEKKGLTKEEIDEAFRRVPDPTPSVSTAQPAVTNQDGQQKSSSTIQTPTTMQISQPAGIVAKAGIFPKFHWSHALLAVGFLAASGAGTAVLFKKSIIPKFKSWIRKIVLEEEEEGLLKKDLKPTVAEEAAAAAKAAAAAASDLARLGQEMLISKTEDKKRFEELTKILDVHVREMTTLMSNAVQKLEVQGNSSRNIHAVDYDDYRASASRQSYGNGKVDVDSRSVRSLSPPATVEPSGPPHPKSYMEIMAMVQRGEKPPNVRDINDMPPNPNQPIPNPRAATKPKPWEVGQAQYSSNNVFQSRGGNDQLNAEYQGNQSNGGEFSADWFERRNARISEIETEDEQKIGSSGVQTNERLVRRSSWVPPQPPPVAMAEAAAAIRQPKKPLVQKEQLTDDQLLARSRSSDVSDELQRITKISESGGVVEANGGSSGVSTSEIQNEENSYLEA